MNNRLKVMLVLVAATLAQPLFAGDRDLTGFVGVDSRGFWQDGQFEGQNDDVEASLIIQPEFYWANEQGDQRVSLVGYARINSTDSERTHADIREAYWSIENGPWDLNIGINKVFWGVTESRHLVDVINQTDLLEDIDGEEKLGQPMLNINLQRDFGRFGLYVLPWFRERSFAGKNGRLRPPLPVDDGNAIFESSDAERHTDFALRYSHYFGDIDVGMHLFEGTSREPRLLPAADGTRLIPVYDQMSQVGIDLQYTHDEWLWKFEGLARDTRVDSFAAAVAGFEYTFYGFRGANADLGILLEYLYDGRNELSPQTSFDNDIFAGARLALNDAQNTSVLAGIAVDIESGEMFLNVEAERRFGDNLSAELRLRAFTHAKPGDSLAAIRQDDYLQLRLSWYY